MQESASLIEDYIPIDVVGIEASREKSLWRGHVATLHNWWARRPLVACRAAIYSALVPADRWVNARDIPIENAPSDDPDQITRWRDGTARGLNRKQARDFLSALCTYPGNARGMDQARQHILEAHGRRLTAELAAAKTGTPPAWVTEFKWAGGQTVTANDIADGCAPRPRVLDLFAGGGAIPLEALRLGCEAYALDLNPVAHIIQLCTLVYPQRFGQPDAKACGMAGKVGTNGKPTWGGLADEVRFWGDRVLRHVKAEVGDLFPLVSDPNSQGPLKAKGSAAATKAKLFDDDEEGGESDTPVGKLLPVAYLWTRTVRCKNPSCGCEVPLLRQSWLARGDDKAVALRPVRRQSPPRIEFEVAAASSPRDLGFDPDAFSQRGNAACLVCGTVADIEYVRQFGWENGLGEQLIGLVCRAPSKRGRVFLPAAVHPADTLERASRFADAAARESSLGLPREPIAGLASNDPSTSLGINVRGYGHRTWADLFNPRQLAVLLAFVRAIAKAPAEMAASGIAEGHAKAVATVLACAVDRLAENLSRLCRWNPTAEKMQGTFGRQTLSVVWDYCEANPFGGSVGDWTSIIDLAVNAIQGGAAFDARPAEVRRGSAFSPPWTGEFLDAIITDPPYYDNVPYADVSDYYYVWLKRTIGQLYPEHFATELTPKKAEAIADAGRHGGDRKEAEAAYERMMFDSLVAAYGVLKPTGQLVLVYAHKTTLGWSTLVDAMRRAGFMVTEAWPLDTEMRTRLRGMDSAALASSIFLVARKRNKASRLGNFEDDVQPELEAIVRERVAALWEMGITGADLVISCVGAGLRAFTRFERVEYASGEAVPAEKFLAEVEAVVLDTLMARLMATTRKAVEGDEETGEAAAGVGGIDAASRFYVLWRYLYKAAELDAGEAIIFANGLHVELDGQGGLCDGRDAMLEKKKSKYRLRDYADRGRIESLGLPGEGGEGAPLIDVLHRTLYLMEHRPAVLREYLDQARPNRERLRLLAASLAGPGLSGKSEEDASRLVATTAAEQSALGKLLANWRTLVPETLFNAGKR